MEIILFRPPACEKCAPFARQVEFWVSPEQLEVCGSLAKLAATLGAQDKGDREKILVLLAENREHLRGLCALRDTLLEHRVILVLPDCEEETLAIGHGLYPRFVMNFDEPPGNLGAVLNKMMQNVIEGTQDRRAAHKQCHPGDPEKPVDPAKPERSIHQECLEAGARRGGATRRKEKAQC